MPKPTSSDVHVSTPLTNVSTAYLQDQNNFVATEAFPEIPVQKDNDKYFVWNKGDLLRLEADERTAGAKVKAGGMGLTTASYTARRYAARWDIPDPLRENQDSAVQLDRAATEWVTLQMLMKREVVWATNYFATGLWTTDYDGVTGAPGGNQFKRWDVSGSTPIVDIKDRCIDVHTLTGQWPNKLILGHKVAHALFNHADILDRIKYTQKGVVTEDLLAQIFKVDKVIVAKAIRNTAAAGATDSLSTILGKHALLCYAAPSPGLMTPTAGYTFSWSGFSGAGPAGNRIKKYRLEEIESDVIEGELACDMKLVAADLGAFFEDAVS